MGCCLHWTFSICFVDLVGEVMKLLKYKGSLGDPKDLFCDGMYLYLLWRTV